MHMSVFLGEDKAKSAMWRNSNEAGNGDSSTMSHSFRCTQKCRLLSATSLSGALMAALGSSCRRLTSNFDQVRRPFPIVPHTNPIVPDTNPYAKPSTITRKPENNRRSPPLLGMEIGKE